MMHVPVVFNLFSLKLSHTHFFIINALNVDVCLFIWCTSEWSMWREIAQNEKSHIFFWHMISPSDFKVVAREEMELRRKIREAIEIREHRPRMNRDTGYDLPPVYTSLLSHDRQIHGGHVTQWEDHFIRPDEALAIRAKVLPKTKIWLVPIGIYIISVCLYNGTQYKLTFCDDMVDINKLLSLSHIFLAMFDYHTLAHNFMRYHAL